MKTDYRTVLALASELLLAALLTACGADATTPSPAATATPQDELAAPGQGRVPGTTFVGTLAGSAAFVGLAKDGAQVVAYVCDGDQTQVTLAQWFKGSVAGDRVTLSNDSGAQFSAQFGSDAATGTITPTGGLPLTFTAGLVSNGGDPGLFRGEGPVDGVATVAGVIVLPNGAEHGAWRQGSKTVRAPAIPHNDLPSYCYPVYPHCCYCR